LFDDYQNRQYYTVQQLTVTVNILNNNGIITFKYNEKKVTNIYTMFMVL